MNWTRGEDELESVKKERREAIDDPADVVQFEHDFGMTPARKVADRALGFNMWNTPPQLDDRRVLGHHPTLEQYDHGGGGRQNDYSQRFGMRVRMASGTRKAVRP